MTEEPAPATGAGPDPFAPEPRAARPADGLGAASPSGSSPSSAGSKVLIIALTALVAIGAVAVWLFLRTDDHRGDLAIAAAGPGQCWNDPDDLAVDEIDTVQEVPCDEAHDNEVFATVEVADTDTYPGDYELQTEAFNRCLNLFEGYVGAPYGESPLEIYTLYPTVASWSSGDRGVVCSLYMLDASEVTGSQQDSALRLASPAIDLSAVGSCADLAERTLVVAQQFIDFFDSVAPEDLEAADFATPPEMLPVMKSESLLVQRGLELGCSFETLNAMVADRAGSLTSSTEFGGYVVDEIIQYGFFATG